jgi:hypothetical protein
MKKAVFFWLLALALCFCGCKKNQSNNNAAATDTVGLSLDDSQKISTDDTLGASSGEEGDDAAATDAVGFSLDDSQKISTDDTLGASSGEEDDDAEEIKARAAWIALMRDTVLSKLRRTISGDGSDEIIAVANTVIKKELDVIGESFLFPQNLDDIDFYIRYNDKNYITAAFNGMYGEGHITHMNWPIKVDIKNKKRLILSDVVRINDQFVKTVFKAIEDNLSEEEKSDLKKIYTAEKLKADLLETDVLYESKYWPSNQSYFDEKDLVIYLMAVRGFNHGYVDLPLDKIRTMIKLPNLPAVPPP